MWQSAEDDREDRGRAEEGGRGRAGERESGRGEQTPLTHASLLASSTRALSAASIVWKRFDSDAISRCSRSRNSSSKRARSSASCTRQSRREG
jgi:hypothetical protein